MLSRKAKYALRALSTLTAARPERLGAARIARDADVPAKFLESILVELRDAGLIDSRRGTVGGHALARPAESVMVGEIIRVIDGPLAPIRCASLSAFEPCNDCPDPTSCALRGLMSDVRQAMSDVLDHRSLADFAKSSETPCNNA